MWKKNIQKRSTPFVSWNDEGFKKIMLVIISEIIIFMFLLTYACKKLLFIQKKKKRIRWRHEIRILISFEQSWVWFDQELQSGRMALIFAIKNPLSLFLPYSWRMEIKGLRTCVICQLVTLQWQMLTNTHWIVFM